MLTKDVVIEKLAEGFDWSEGPVWMPGGYLLFSDVPQNTIFKSNARSGVSIFLQPSGYTGTEPRGGGPGSNGLTHDKQGRLIACQQGDRRVAGWENGKFVSVADRFEGKRFNSPNDVVVKSNGDIYFTDPPYCLPENVNDSAKEIPFQGVYRVSAKDGSVTLLTSKVTRPNGLAFSPDEKIFYVANSDPSKAIWMAFPVNADGTLGTGRVFLDLTDSLDAGVPDGLKVDQRGNLWATGPGGVLIISPRRQTSRHAGNWRGRVELRLGRGRLHAFHHRSQVSLPRAHEGERSGILIREVKGRGEFVAAERKPPYPQLHFARRGSLW